MNDFPNIWHVAAYSAAPIFLIAALVEVWKGKHGSLPLLILGAGLALKAIPILLLNANELLDLGLNLSLQPVVVIPTKLSSWVVAAGLYLFIRAQGHNYSLQARRP